MPEGVNYINIGKGEQDFSLIQETENRLTQDANIDQAGPKNRPAMLLQQTSKEIPIAIPNNLALIENGETIEGHIDLNQLAKLYDSEGYGFDEYLDQQTFEELYLELGAEAVMLTETIEVPAIIDSSEQAIATYTTWLKSRNNQIANKLQNKATEDKAKIVSSWATLRTLGKNEYLEKLTSAMKDHPEELKIAINQIQMLATAQLVIEGDVIGEYKTSRGITGPGVNTPDLVSNYVKASANGVLAGAIFENEDYQGNTFKQIKETLPENPDYIKAFESTRAGVMGEAYGMKMLFESLENLDAEEGVTFEIRHSSQQEDMAGGDIVMHATKKDGTRVSVVGDIKTSGAGSTVYTLEDRGIGVNLYSGENPRNPEIEGVPPNLINLITDQKHPNKNVFDDLGSKVKGIVMRIGRNVWETQDPEELENFQNELKGNLNWAFA